MLEGTSSNVAVKVSSNRAFGVVFTVVLLIIAALPSLRGAAPYWPAGIVAAGFALVSALAPAWLAPLNRLWTRIGLLMHRVVSPIVLGVMFFLVVTPIGVLMRIAGKDPLRLRLDKAASSYWIDRTPPGPEPTSLTDQF